MGESVGDWNHRQVFGPSGVIFMIGTLNCGCYCVFRMAKSEMPNAMVASEHFPSEADVIAEAERLRKASLN